MVGVACKQLDLGIQGSREWKASGVLTMAVNESPREDRNNGRGKRTAEPWGPSWTLFDLASWGDRILEPF